MGSTLEVLRGYVERQLDITTTADTVPSNTNINDFINTVTREVGRRIKPVELQNSTPLDHSITSGTNKVTLNTTLLYPQIVYYFNSQGKGRQLVERDLQQMIVIEGANNFFDSSNTGDPSYFAYRGREIVTNKYFNRTDATGIRIFGITKPTVLSSDSDETDLSDDYDMLVIFKVTALCYQIIDDTENQTKYEMLATREENELNIDLDYRDAEVIQLDPVTFSSSYKDYRDPSTFFGGG